MIGPSIHTFRAGWTGLLFVFGLALASAPSSAGQSTDVPTGSAKPGVRSSTDSGELSRLPRYQGVRWHSAARVDALGHDGLTAKGASISHGFDARLLRTVYGWEGQGLSAWLTISDRSAYPLMFGSVPAWWAGAAFSDEVSGQDAAAFTLAWVATAGVTVVGKRLIGRSRPYATHADISPKKGGAGLNASSSFPSGHASLSAVTAAYLIHEYPGWTSGALAGGWAASVAVSRVWLGVHYPSDVAAGLVLGGVAAWAAQQLK